MKLLIRQQLVALILISLVGCTTMQELRPQDGSLAGTLKVGDHIIVHEASGRIIDMRFVKVDNGILLGSLLNDGLHSVEIKVEQIERIEAERIAMGRTTAAVIGGIVLLPIAAVGAGIGLASQ